MAKVNLSLNQSIKDSLIEEAVELGLSPSEFVVELLKNYLEETKKNEVGNGTLAETN